ncbi:MAG: phospholipid carrier-dependent glycosyltransferase [Desulfobacteraceae bacterium]|nr:phospholipid carrier-dependent glycosyltransferase [Desulfobacteraceae bacterium]MBC2718181.1 phospholipid carrier-dependent glycosyltransferase [Desulfobacteraceae bacterium]
MPMTSTEKFKIKLLFLIGVAHILISVFTIVPGNMSIDEVTYHRMTKSFSESGGLEIWNGYRECPSPELETRFIFARNGRLVSQYPYLFPVLSTPFYRIWGYRGLFFINVIAFAGIVFFCYVIAKKLFQNRNLALNSCFILIFATFSWEYSQAAWPHATTTFFLMASFYLFVCSFYAKTGRAAFLLALASGFITGFAMGIRLDSIFVLPCLIIPFLFLKPYRPLPALATCIGALPGLVILTATNYAKFGVLSPFSYGRSIEASELKRYLPFAVLGILTMIILWVLTRRPVISILCRYKRTAIITIILLVGVLAMIPQVRSTVGNSLNGAYQLIVDFRVRDLDIKEGGLSRSEGGGMVYINGLKKSLLQSCPYLVVLLLPFLKIIRNDKESVQLTILFLVPMAFTGFYSYHNGWHGGWCMNLRYFIPILPFTSMLSAYAWREISGNINLNWGRMCLLTSFVFAILFLTTLNGVNAQEFPFLTLPLLLALLLTILLLTRETFAKLSRYLFPRTAVVIFFVAIVWSSLVAFLYDYPRACLLRHYTFNVAKNAAKVVSVNSILFTFAYEPFVGLIERGRIRIAIPAIDDFHDFPGLIKYHFQNGHSVYTAFTPLEWEDIKKRGMIDQFKIIPIEFDDNYILSELVMK